MTSKAQKWTYEQCKAEQEFIERHNPNAPGAGFHHNPKTFAEYCNQQANHVLHSGFRLIAGDITTCRDIAQPNYRSIKQNEGHETFESFSIPYGFYSDVAEELRQNKNEYRDELKRKGLLK